MVDPRFAEVPSMPAARWAARFGISDVIDHLGGAAPATPEAQAALGMLGWTLNHPEQRERSWQLGENPPHRPDRALDDLADYRSLNLWAARYLRQHVEAALAPIVASVDADWLARATAVICEPALLEHARRTLLSLEEQVEVADSLLDEPRRIADGHVEEEARAMCRMAATPEEWVARYRHTLTLGYAFEMRYADPGLDRWMARVYGLIRSPDMVDLLRQQFLTAEEWAGLGIQRDLGWRDDSQDR